MVLGQVELLLDFALTTAQALVVLLFLEWRADFGFEFLNALVGKVEISAEQSLLLPFDQFAFAELKSEGKQQELRLVFATHEVMLRGHSLRRIETAMQRMELASLSALSGNQRSLVTDGQPVIAEIAVTEVAAADKRPPAEKE